MADPQPAELWQFGRPATGTPVRSEEVRKNFDSLSVLFRTDSEDFPVLPRDGMPRFLTSDPNNIRLQVWYDSAWRTIAQFIQFGLPAPSKLEQRFETPATTWTVTHNLGSRPLIQVYSLTGVLLQQVSLTTPPRDVVELLSVSPAILTSLAAGPTVMATWVATFRGALDALILSVLEAVAGASPDLTFEVAINGTPTTGGQLALGAPTAFGTRLSGAAPSSGNEFEIGDTVTVQVTAGGGNVITAGALRLYMDVERRLQPGQYLAQHASENQLVITHPSPTSGFALVIG